MLNKTYIYIVLIFILVGCSSSDGNSTSELDSSTVLKSSQTVELMPSNWYVRLVVEDMVRALKSESAQLGELEDINATQKHALKSVTPFDGTYLDVVFHDPVGVAPGEYKADFHTFQESREARWQFTVKTDDANAEIVLYWRGLYILTPYVDEQCRLRYKEYKSMTNPLLRQMKLVDTLTTEELPVIDEGLVQKYLFSMDGMNERTFEWVVTNEEVNITSSSSRRSDSRSPLFIQDLTTRKAEALQQKSERFDLHKPPMFLENR